MDAPIVIKSVDMPEDLQEDAVRTILDALEKNQLEKVRASCSPCSSPRLTITQDVAAFIKKVRELFSAGHDLCAYSNTQDFDSRHSPTWHVIVGRNFGSYVTHQTGHFLYAYVKDVAIVSIRFSALHGSFLDACIAALQGGFC